MSVSWYRRFLASTRGRLIALLRRETRTVDELAAELGLTDNAVRAHLASLERDGLVRQHGVRRGGGVGKPAYAYALTAGAEQFFPRPYATVLSEMLNVLDAQATPGEVEQVMREAGRRIAHGYQRGEGDTRSRIETAAAALNQLGGLAEVADTPDGIHIQGYGCPLAEVVVAHTEACHLAEAFVAEVAGIPVRECCNREGTPRCRFEPIEQPNVSDPSAVK